MWPFFLWWVDLAWTAGEHYMEHTTVFWASGWFAPRAKPSAGSLCRGSAGRRPPPGSNWGPAFDRWSGKAGRREPLRRRGLAGFDGNGVRTARPVAGTRFGYGV